MTLPFSPMNSLVAIANSRGPASLADYQRMLAAVTLSTADAGVKTVTFSVTATNTVS